MQERMKKKMVEREKTGIARTLSSKKIKTKHNTQSAKAMADCDYSIQKKKCLFLLKQCCRVLDIHDRANIRHPWKMKN